MDDEAAISETPTSTADLDARLDGELDIDAQQLIEEIRQRHETLFAVPKGAFTRRQFMKATGYGKTRALELLAQEVEAGQLVVAQVKVRTGGYQNVWMRADDAT